MATYDHDPATLSQLKAKLMADISELLSAETFEDVDPELWQRFQLPGAPGTPDPTTEDNQEQFARLRKALEGEEALQRFQKSVDAAMAPLMQWGILESLPVGASAREIFVRTLDGETRGTPAKKATAELLMDNALASLQASLNQELGSVELAQRVYAWLGPQLQPTLEENVDDTRRTQDEASADVPIQTNSFRAGEDKLATAGHQLTAPQIDLMRLEYDQLKQNQSLTGKALRSLAVLGLYFALFTLCGFYLMARDSNALSDLGMFGKLLGLVLLTVLVAQLLYPRGWGTELVPLMIFAMTVTIAFQQELALLLSASVVLVVVVALGLNLQQALVIMATVSGAILTLHDVRTRGKLLAVGFVSAAERRGCSPAPWQWPPAAVLHPRVVESCGPVGRQAH